ncbi:hypothetical protein [Agromyces archimandritae]|uniref:hypothetical protein n=1 Tax=Agromyces archimandritae TaxID=2781962 RepID=UPI001FD035EF|nr:hypothetical protein [Agromyces archimandritae]
MWQDPTPGSFDAGRTPVAPFVGGQGPAGVREVVPEEHDSRQTASPLAAEPGGHAGSVEAAPRHPLVSRGTAPAGTAAGTAPVGAAAGTAPAGTAPAGTAPAGTAPAGTAPAGTAPADTAPSAGIAPRHPHPEHARPEHAVRELEIGPAHPFTAPATRPLDRRRCTMTKKIITGTVMSVEAAMM